MRRPQTRAPDDRDVLAMTRLTIFRKPGGPLTKQITLRDDGTVRADGSACVMSEGMAHSVEIATPRGLAALIDKMPSDKALALGRLRDGLADEVGIVTKDRINGVPRPDLIARTGSNIIFEKGRPAWVLLDFDTKGMPVEVRQRLNQLGGFWRALCSIIPDLEGTAWVRRRSTSAGLYRTDTNEWVKGSRGLHVYVQVEDGADIERFLRALHDRCWLHGLGWLMVGAGGQLLDRSIVDRMVGAPERLVFEGAPILEPPLAQDAKSRRPVPHDGDALATAPACPPISVAERARIDEAKAKAAHRLAPQAARAREGFIANRAKAFARRTGLPLNEARRAIERQCDGVLLPDVVLPFDDPALVKCTVADVLADPGRFEGETLADPLEGVGYGRCKAKILRRADGTPWIHSFAHGRTTYELKNDARAVRTAIENSERDAAVKVLIEQIAQADIDSADREHLIELAAKRSGVGKRVIASMIRQAEKQREAQREQDEKSRQLAERLDPRPRVPVPPINGPWLPVMATIGNELSICSVASLKSIAKSIGSMARPRAVNAATCALSS